VVSSIASKLSGNPQHNYIFVHLHSFIIWNYVENKYYYNFAIYPHRLRSPGEKISQPAFRSATSLPTALYKAETGVQFFNMA